MKIRTKVLMVILPILILPLILVGFTSYFSARQGITKVTREFLSYKVAEMYKYCRRQEDILIETGLAQEATYRELAKKSAEEYAKTIGLSETGYFMAFNSNGKIIFPEINISDLSGYSFFKNIKGKINGLITFDFIDGSRIGYFMYYEPWDWYLLLSEKEGVFYENANSIKKQVAFIMGITLVIAVIFILFSIKKITDPIGNVVSTMKEIITTNDLSKRVKVEYDDEIGYLATWFNYMIEDLEIAYNKIKEYAYKSVLAKNNEERIRHIFQKYVPAEVIDEVMKSSGKELLIGKKQVVTILFSDIRSFTTISERMSAEELVTSLNTYFNLMVGIIIQHKGIIDKFIGDAIMAIFGAPAIHEDDPLQATITGLEMLESLKSFNQRQRKLGKPPFRIGIGINTGEVVVGNIGSTQKLDYTCVGDTVNLASRLEGLTKLYRVPIIISEHTHKDLNGRVKARELDSVRVMGKLKPVRIYEPYIPDSGKKETAFDIFNSAIELYREKKFKEALDLFRECRENLPDDIPSSMYIDRCIELINNPPSVEWDGVYTAATK